MKPLPKFIGWVIGSRPVIPVLFEVPTLGISNIIRFTIDTGSNCSLIAEKDAVLIGLDCSLLLESKDESIGFGGTFRNKIINQLVKLTFKSNKEEYTINYGNGFRVTCFPPNLKKEEREKLLRLTPSVLGMEILKKFELYMKENKVELTSIS